MPSSHPNNYSLARTFSSLLVVASLVLSSARGGAIENACADDDAGSSNAGGGGRRRRPDSAVSELLDWLRENGAHVSPKVAVGRVDPDDPNSPRGVFAVDDMDEGETVCVIPWDLMIVPDLVIDPMVDDDCGTIHAVYDAMSEGGKTPYAKYLLDQPVDYLPSFWSQAARDLLQDMLRTARANSLTKSDQLPPRRIKEMIDIDVVELCGIAPERMSDPLFRQAAMLSKARSDYLYMVPFYDMMNHHNGKYNTAHKYNPYGTLDDSEIKPIGYEIVTTKKITKSEEIYNSYNRCNICHEYFDHVGTPEIFNMFGFVEVMPQRWLFDFARVKFDLDWRDADESTGDVVVSFLVPPSERGIALLQEELDRLSLFATHRDDDPKDAGIPASEWQSLWQYYDALHYALSCAVHQSSNGNMTDDVWKLDENWWVHDGTLTAADDEDHGVYPTINA